MVIYSHAITSLPPYIGKRVFQSLRPKWQIKSLYLLSFVDVIFLRGRSRIAHLCSVLPLSLGCSAPCNWVRSGIARLCSVSPLGTLRYLDGCLRGRLTGSNFTRVDYIAHVCATRVAVLLLSRTSELEFCRPQVNVSTFVVNLS